MATNKDLKVKNGIAASGAITGTSVNGITGLSSTVPVIDGVGTVGTATTAARADHVHPAPTVSSVSNLADGALGQVPFQSATSTTAFSADLTFDSVNSALTVGNTGGYPVTIGGPSNTLYQLAGASGSLIIRSQAGNAIRLYTDYGTGVRGGNINFYAGGSDSTAGAGNIQLSTGVNTNPGYSGIIKMIGATGYWVGSISGSGATSIDLGTLQSTFLDVYLSANTTFSFVTSMTAVPYHEVRMRIAANTLGYAVTWPGNITWISGAAPVISTTAYTTIALFTFDGGTTYHGYSVGSAGTVTSVSVTTANGISGTVATNTTTPALTLTLGAITPSSISTTGTITSSDHTTARTAAPTTGYVYYGNTGTKYAGFDGTNFVSSMPMSFNIIGSSTSCSGNAATATNQAGGAANQIQYNTAANTSSFIAAPTTASTYLQWNGSAFTWAPLPFDIAQFINGKPLASEILVKVIFPRAVSFPANFSGSYAKCVVAPTASTVLTVLKNGVNVGTLTFAAAGTTGTFSTSALSFSAADLLVIQAPASVDATFADFACTLTGT
jgi:hypothetical protein